ncbi:hypothetical protein DKX38_001221 [Salix brachista]|uniref:RRM domain-containing protein n=1 Tax=Salix brachista TaxID=2182728 RepID=A0A5N5P437_9ROSI|nr:hypothetical protein DKX38_001221 [Salix brachista]
MPGGGEEDSSKGRFGDDLKVYFSVYGNIVDYQIMLDHKTGRSRGFGFVTSDSEDVVEIKKVEPKRTGGDYGSATKSCAGFGNGAGNSLVGCYGRKMGREYGGYSGYDDCSCYGGSYPGSTAGIYDGYGAYGYGFGGPMINKGYGGSANGGAAVTGRCHPYRK